VLRLYTTVTLRELVLSPLRSALVVGGIASGVALMTSLAVVNRGIVEHFRQSVLAVAGDVQLQVVSPGGEMGVDGDIAVDVGSVPGVALAVPVIDKTVPASTPDHAIRLFATDFTNRRVVDAYHIEVESGLDPSRLLTETFAVLIPGGSHTQPSLPVGATLTVVGASGPTNLTVAGHLSRDGALGAAGQSFAAIDFMVAQQLLGVGSMVDRIDVVPEPGQSLPELTRAIGARVGPRYAVVTPFGRGEYLERAVGAFQATIHGFGLLGLVTAIFIVYSTVSTSLTQRRRILGMLRALGVRRREVITLLAVEAGVLGLIASLIGGMVGVALAHRLVGLIETTMGMIFLSRFDSGPLGIDTVDFLMAIALGTAAAILASLYPAVRAATLDPLDAMVDVRSDSDRTRIQPRVFLVGSLALVVVVAITVITERRLRSVIFGNIASVAWFVAFILVSVPAIAWLATQAAPLLERRLGITGKLASENLRRSAARSAVAVSALGLSLATTMTFAGIIRSFEDSAVAWVRQVLAGDLLVASTHSQGGWLEEPISQAIVSKVEAVPGVDSIDTFRLLPGQRMGNERIAVEAMSESYLQPEYYRDWFIDGDAESALAATRTGTAALVSESLAVLSGLRTGDTIAIEAPRGRATLPIAGIVVDYTSDRGSVIIEQKTLTRFWGDDRVNRIRVHAAEGATVPELQSSIAAALANPADYKVLTAGELVDYHVHLFEAAFSPASILELLLIIVTCAGIIDVVIASVHDRHREFALMRASGASVRDIERMTMIEVAVIIAAGLFLGIVGGSISAWLWVNYHFTYLLGWVLTFHFPWMATARGVALGAIVAALAAYLPVRRAARAPVLEALHYE
jgi:putative ABC transport system permease protein